MSPLRPIKPRALGSTERAVERTVERTTAEQVAGRNTEQLARAARSTLQTGRTVKGASPGILSKTAGIMNDAAFEIAVNNMLFQPHTGIINAMSNMAMLVAKPVETATRVATSVFNKPEDRTYLSELIAESHGLASGVISALKYQGQRAKNIVPGLRESKEASLEAVGAHKQLADVSKIYEHKRYINAQNMGLDEESLIGQIANGLGSFINAPGAVLNHTDISFKIIHAEQAKARRAAHMVKTGEAVNMKDAYRRIAANSDLSKEIVQEAEYFTYQGKPKSKLFNWIMDSKLADGKAMRWLVPFKRSIANIAEMGAEYSPIAMAVPELRRRLLFGTPAEKAAARAKLIAGTTITAVAGYTLADHLNGRAPKDPIQKEMWQNAYGKEFTLNIGGQEIELDALGPYGTLLKVIALYNQYTINDKDLITDNGPDGNMRQAQRVAEFIAPVVQAFADSHWSQNFNEFLTITYEAIEDQNPKRLLRWVERMGVLTIPGIGAAEVKRISEQQDPIKRPYKNIGDALKRAIPGLSEKVRPSYSWDGSPILVNRYQGKQTLPFITNPYYKDDPLERHLLEIGAKFEMTADYVRTPSVESGKPGPRVYLNNDEWDYYHKILREGVPGRVLPFRKVVEGIVKSSQYQRQKTKELKRGFIRLASKKYHELAMSLTKANTPLGQRIIKVYETNKLKLAQAEGVQVQ